MNLKAILAKNPYPGRGIVLGMSKDGMRAHLAYFIMGRSENSRNRVFVQQEGDIFTQAADPAKVADPSLIIYRAVHRMGEHTIVTNGDQTDTIAESLQSGGSFEDALRQRSFEPDAPVFTPRISGLFTLGMKGFSYQLSILKSEGAGQSVRRFFFEYPQPSNGVGHFIHTYAAADETLPSFAGEPIAVDIEDGLDAFGQGLWESLHAENKVALFVRTIMLDGQEGTKIYNKYSKI